MAVNNNITPGELTEGFYGSNPDTLSASTTSAQATLTPGYYKMVATGGSAFYFLMGSNPTATTSSNYVASGFYYPIKITTAGTKVAVILASGTDTIQFQRAKDD
jgi:hypothetical protein